MIARTAGRLGRQGQSLLLITALVAGTACAPLAARAAGAPSPPPSAPALAAAPPRSAWTYDLPDLPPRARDAALEGLAARGVTRLFLSAEDGPRARLDTPAARAAVARAAAAAKGRGMAVHAMLLQDPRWLDDPDGAAVRVAAAAAFGDAPGEPRFDGIHLDVEPYTLEAWECGGPEGRARLTRRLADLVARVRAAAGGLPISVALPWWMLRAAGGAAEGAVRRLAAAADEVVLMAYGEPGGPLVGGPADRLVCRLGLPGLLDRLPAGTRASVGLAAYEHPDAAALDARADRLDERLGASARYAGAALFLDAAPPDAPLVVPVRGRVVGRDGRARPGAVVTARTADPPGPPHIVTANRCGRFLVRLPRPGAATLVVTAREGPRAGLASIRMAGLVAGREREAGTVTLSAPDRPPAPAAAPPADPALPPQAAPLAAARALALEGRAAEAAAAYRAILARWPHEVDAKLGLARIAAWQGHRPAAAAAYRAILAERCDAAEALLGLADLSRWEGRPGEAARLYAEVATDWPHEPAGFVGLGRLALEAGRRDEARRHLTRALALDPSHPEARALLTAAGER